MCFSCLQGKFCGSPSPSESVAAPSPLPSLPVSSHLNNFASSSTSITASSPFSSTPVAPKLSNEGMNTEPFNPDGIYVVLHIPSMNLHPMQTQSKTRTIKQKACFTTINHSSSTDLSLIEPANYNSVLQPTVWFAVMKEEIVALHSHGTWSLVPLPSYKNLVGYKWIFKIKKHADGSISHHKARLIAQGFSQEPDQDYLETFSPVVKPIIV